MKPLDSYDELINWNYNDTNEKCLVDYKGQILQEKTGATVSKKSALPRNKVLFCHDYKGGYLDDANMEKNENIYAYRFYHWHLIDSRFLPLGGPTIHTGLHDIIESIGLWVHRNGVSCLGTFIVENRNDISMFYEKTNVEMMADKLNDIRKCYNFEGWLINLEFRVQGHFMKQTIENIVFFLGRLVSLGNEVHWYDAITVEGDLSWQNGLNEKNKIFYDSCGNIFLNYCWNENTLAKSIEMVGGNVLNIFVGIDCFGRGCPGGGGFCCNKAFDMLEKIYKTKQPNMTKFSIALFAAGWCHENVPLGDFDKKLDDNIWRFFNLIERFLQPCSDGCTFYRQLPEVDLTETRHFITNFDIGQGVCDWKDGREVSRGKYNRLMDENWAPTGLILENLENVRIKILPYRQGGYNGHSCFVMSAEYDKGYGDLQFQPINVELFRIGCHLNKIFANSFTLTLGCTGNLNIDLWDSIHLVFHFNDGNGDIRISEFPFGKIKIDHSNSGESTIKWNVFKINDLATTLGVTGEFFTIRIVKLKIMTSFVVDYVKDHFIYFGDLAIDCM